MANNLDRGCVTLFIGTRKGAFLATSDTRRQKWALSDPIHLGHIVFHLVPDMRDRQTVLMAAKTGHLGPTVYFSKDRGNTWCEASKPPAFSKSENGNGRAVESVFWLSPQPADEPGVWYAGTSPAGLFRSDDSGANWQAISGWNENPHYETWLRNGATPGGQMVHSIIVDQTDKRHIYLCVSVGGVFESTDAGNTWAPLNKGLEADFMPDAETAEFGHDPHCMVQHPAAPGRLYQQNHCGIYRLDRPGNKWVRIGRNMPAEIGDIGFPIVVHPRNPDCAWVFPMDGSSVWPRTSPGGKPATYKTMDAGASWIRQDKGLPSEKAYFTVKRQAMTSDGLDKLGLYFGTTQGEVWASNDEGGSWYLLIRHLPEIYSLAAVAY